MYEIGLDMKINRKVLVVMFRENSRIEALIECQFSCKSEKN